MYDVPAGWHLLYIEHTGMMMVFSVCYFLKADLLEDCRCVYSSCGY